MQDISDRFSDPRPIILDGATSTELERRGVPMDAGTWSGLAALSHPDVLRELHADYLRAGAEVIIANTYAAAPSTSRRRDSATAPARSTSARPSLRWKRATRRRRGRRGSRARCR